MPNFTESVVEDATLHCFSQFNCVVWRDALLPKLLSGEIRMKDAEGIVEDKK